MLDFEATLRRLDAVLADLERAVRAEAAPLEAVLDRAIAATCDTLRACMVAARRDAVPPEDADLLDVWRALARGDPTWNAVRDNCRELVYYRNCLAVGRRDALPAVPAAMAVRTARHVFLYARTRALTAGWSADG